MMPPFYFGGTLGDFGRTLGTYTFDIKAWLADVYEAKDLLHPPFCSDPIRQDAFHLIVFGKGFYFL
jgi:hypothetical protein